MSQHPNDVLFRGLRSIPVLSACEHFAGIEKRIRKALELQSELAGRFDVTADCEDGAPAGRETEHMEMVVDLLHSSANRHQRLGVRIHSYDHAHWRRDVEILVPAAGAEVAYLTIPKPAAAAQVEEMVAFIGETGRAAGLDRTIPVHVLIETQDALRDVWQIAAVPTLEVLDFGLMDFVSDHQGAIPSAAMRAPGQFEHRLVARAKTEIAAAALANGLVPAHNVTLDIKSPEQVASDAARARREFGFLRMWSIHPVQVEAILEAMRPDFSELESASAVLCAAQDADWGPIQHAGGLHDRGTYREAWRLVQAARI